MKTYILVNDMIQKTKAVIDRSQMPYLKDQCWKTYTEKDNEALEDMDLSEFILYTEDPLLRIDAEFYNERYYIQPNIRVTPTLTNYYDKGPDNMMKYLLFNNRLVEAFGCITYSDTSHKILENTFDYTLINKCYNIVSDLHKRFINDFDSFIKNCIEKDTEELMPQNRLNQLAIHMLRRPEYPILSILNNNKLKDTEGLYKWLKETGKINVLPSKEQNALKMHFEPQNITFKDYMGSIGEDE